MAKPKNKKSGMSRPTSNWVTRTELKSEKKIQRQFDKFTVREELEMILEEEDANPTGMCQSCGGVCSSDSNWCGCC
jgi:hypothetical protein